MKKKIRHLDGTVVEYEGTPEELATLEESLSNSSRKDESKGNGPRILNEKRVTEQTREIAVPFKGLGNRDISDWMWHTKGECTDIRCTRCFPISMGAR